MSPMNLRHPMLLLALCGVLAACGKKDEPAPEPETEKASEGAEAGDGAADKAEADAHGEGEGDAHGEGEHAAKDEDATAPGKVRRPGKDRLTGRRPPPVRRDLKSELEGDAGARGDETADAGSAAEGDATADAGPTGVSASPDLRPRPAPGEPAVVPSPEVPVKGEAPPEIPARPEHTAADTPTPNARVPQPGAAQPFYDAGKLLPLATALEITQAKNLTPAGALAGIAASPSYGSLFYKAPSADEFGVSVQAWHDPARRESDDRFRRMRLQYPGAEDVQVLAPMKAFFAQFGKIQMLTFVDSIKRVVVSVGCGEGLCTHEELVKLAKAIRDRI